MPLTQKGEEIMQHMQHEYGSEKGEQVFYASRNAGKLTGVDSSIFSQYDPFSIHEGQPIDNPILPTE
jgi:hypothetical protein